MNKVFNKLGLVIKVTFILNLLIHSSVGLATSSSEANRKKHNHAIQIGYGLLSSGLAYDYYLNENKIIRFSSVLDILSYGVTTEIGYKRFWSDSFYTKSSIVSFSSLGGSSFSRSGIRGGIGQEWQWDNGFTIGLEYFGVSLLEKDKGNNYCDPEYEIDCNEYDEPEWPQPWSDTKPSLLQFSFGLAW